MKEIRRTALTTNELALVLGSKPDSVRQMKFKGCGPPTIEKTTDMKANDRSPVFYSVADVRKYLEENAQVWLSRLARLEEIEYNGSLSIELIFQELYRSDVSLLRKRS